MKGGEVFLKAFEDKWFRFEDPKLKSPQWIKVYSSKSRYNSYDTSNCRVMITGLKTQRLPIKSTTLSYYKLFNNCTVEDDQAKLDELIVMEAKLRLMN